MRIARRAGVGVVLMALTVGTAAETNAENWQRGVATYGDGCARISQRDTVLWMKCVNDWLLAEKPAPRQVDPDSLEGRLTARYGERCELAGYRPSTGAFGQCLLAYDDAAKEAEARENGQRRALALGMYLQQQGQYAQQQAARDAQTRALQQRLLTLPPPPTPGAICTTVVGNTLVSRPCY